MSFTPEQYIDPERYQIYWDFVAERHAIWYRRNIEKRPWPWTDDVVLQRTSFTNMYRRIDPGTQYLIDNVLEIDAPAMDKAWNVLIYRLLGRQHTFENIGYIPHAQFDELHYASRLKYVRNVLKVAPFSIAYLVSGYAWVSHTRDKCEKVPWLFNMWHDGFPELWEKVVASTDISEVCKLFMDLKGMGQFLSYQVCIDLTYSLASLDGNNLLLFNRDQWEDWVQPGPGAEDGLVYLTGGQLDWGPAIPGNLSKGEINKHSREFVKYLHSQQVVELNKRGFQWLRKGFTVNTIGHGDFVLLSLADQQNSLCEWQKHMKISRGEGKGRRHFIPPDKR